MKYQLVIQFPEELFKEMDEIAELEDRLDDSLIDAEVDGHDFGSGECNFFIHTNNHVNTFETIKHILKERNFNFEYVKIAFRELGSDQYIAIWPVNLKVSYASH